jgi:hypothetical protein
MNGFQTNGTPASRQRSSICIAAIYEYVLANSNQNSSGFMGRHMHQSPGTALLGYGDSMSQDESKLPKYKRRGFLAKQYSLYYGARVSTRTAQRYGNDDDPIAPIEGVQAIRPPHEVTEEIDPADINDI